MLLKFWRKKQALIRKNLEGSRLHHFWGQTLFHKLLWRTDRRSIAGGLAFGLFIAFTPTLGFQMTMAVIGALLLKVNLPIAIAACWLTNPLTAVPVYTAEWELGKYLIEHIEIFQSFLQLHQTESRGGQLLLNGVYLWTGSLIFAAAAALLGALLVNLLWLLPRLGRGRKSRRSFSSPCNSEKISQHGLSAAEKIGKT
ncbi:MAG: DUF2062 domain-containing protein [Phycisphaerae bacterium]|nr:DUF2062 domain-containing protein [Phycisphaerae bacterium]